MELRVKDDFPEIGRVSQRLEDRTIELASQVNLALDPVTEAEPYDEVSHVPRFDQPRHRYSSGGMGVSGRLPLARSQFSSNSATCACLHSCTWPSARRGRLPQRTTPSRMLTAASYSP